MSLPSSARARRALALAGLAWLAAGLLILPAAAHSAAATGTSASAAVRTSSVTVRGPRLYDGTSKLLSRRSTVTVSQTASLVNQEVRVSWANFTPSTTTGYDTQSSLYAVMVAECRGTHPVGWSQCYGADNGGVEGSSGPVGPYNAVYDTTAPNGTGFLDINVETALENSFLGCDQHHPCSLVVVSGQGGNETGYPNTKFQCNDHSEDVFGGYAKPESTFSSTSGYCSWKDRIVIPLHFSSAVTGCPLRHSAFTAAGSPMMARAMLQWLSGLCAGGHPLAVSYNSTIQEPQALGEAASGIVDVALTTRPASADSAEGVTLPGNRHFIYAPIAVSAASIAFWFDNSNTGQPFLHVKLNQRLVAKLITTSYGFGDGCTKGQPSPTGIGYCDKAIKGNPFNLFADREFTRLNREITPAATSGDNVYQVPTVQSGNSDMTWTLTRWIAANPVAGAFLHGQKDPWGMHVNTYYRGVQYPTDAFVGQDPYPFIQHRYNPLFPLSQVAYHQALNWDAGTSWQKDQYGNYPTDTPEIPGQRALIAILDQADAAAFQLPVAAVANAAGHYAVPSNGAMAAAVAHMSSAGSGTRQANLADTDPRAYPLTMVIYAVVPTSGTPSGKAAAIARFLDFAAGAGQTPGAQPGTLPAGYLPLPASLRAQTQQAATEVADQTGNKASAAHAASPTPTPTTPAVSAPAKALSSPSPKPSISLPRVTPSMQRITTMTVANPQQAASTRFALPALLIFGGLAALGGSAALAGSASTSISAWLGRMRRGGMAVGRDARRRLVRR